LTISDLLTRLQQDKIVVVQEQEFIDKKIYLLGYAPCDISKDNYPLDVTRRDREITEIEYDVIKRWFPALSSS